MIIHSYRERTNSGRSNWNSLFDNDVLCICW